MLLVVCVCVAFAEICVAGKLDRGYMAGISHDYTKPFNVSNFLIQMASLYSLYFQKCMVLNCVVKLNSLFWKISQSGLATPSYFTRSKCFTLNF